MFFLLEIAAKVIYNIGNYETSEEGFAMIFEKDKRERNGYKDGRNNEGF